MGVYKVHSEPVRYSYHAPIFSFAVFVQLLIFGLLLTLPYIIAYATAGMWLFERCYFQQPAVLFKHDVYMSLQGSAPFSQLAWSTVPKFNRLVQDQLRVPVVRSYEEDVNNDGVNDWLQLEIAMPLADAEAIDHLSVAVIFDYQLHYMSNVKMETMVYYQFTGTGSGASLSVDGDMVLTQTEPLPWRGPRDIYNVAIIDKTSVHASSYDFGTITQEYMNRNETTSYEHVLPVWKSDRAAGQPFKLSMRVRYRPQRICYRPGFWQEIKFGWVQYVAILIPLLFLAQYVRWFVFGNQLVETIVRQDASSRFKAHGD